jgi:hypothetical protein
VAKAQERVLGEAGRAAAVAETKRDLEDAERRLDRAREAMGTASTRYEEFEAALERERHRQRLLVDVRELVGVRIRATETAASLRQAARGSAMLVWRMTSRGTHAQQPRGHVMMPRRRPRPFWNGLPVNATLSMTRFGTSEPRRSGSAR